MMPPSRESELKRHTGQPDLQPSSHHLEMVVTSSLSIPGGLGRRDA